MINLSPIEELREARRRLAQAANHDARQYAALLQEVAAVLPGSYLAQPLLPETSPVRDRETNFPDSLQPDGGERDAKRAALSLP